MSLKLVDLKKSASLKIESGRSYKIELPQALSEEAKKEWIQSHIESLLIKEGLVVEYKIKRDQSNSKDCLHITIRGIEESGLPQGESAAFAINDLPEIKPKPARKKRPWWWKWSLRIFLIYPLEVFVFITRTKLGCFLVFLMICTIIRKIFWNFGYKIPSWLEFFIW